MLGAHARFDEVAARTIGADHRADNRQYAEGVAIPLVQPMAASVAAELPIGPEWLYEVKWDGYRALLLKDGARTRLISRNLKDLTADYPSIAAGARPLPDAVLLDGEIVALDEEGRPTFQALQHRSIQRTAIVFYAFDLLHLGSASYLKRPLRERRQALDALPLTSPLLRSVALPGTPAQIEKVIRDAGLEGVVAKRCDSIYEPGRRSLAWMKVKFSPRQEFVVGGYKPGGTTFDSILVGFYDGRRFLYAGKVRAGFRPHTRANVFERISGREISHCPFANLPNSTGRSHWGEGVTADDMKTLRWVAPRLVVEVAFTEWTAGGNLRHASFLGTRDDKPARNVGRLR
jgi:bifunctional non-homologous end joining protein LigD